MKVTIYNASTGEIACNMICDDLETVLLNIGDSELCIEGEYSPEAYYIDIKGDPQPLPERPGPWSQWNGVEWSDPRTAEDLDAEMSARRSTVALSKAALIEVLIAQRLLPLAEIEQVMRGEIPASMVNQVNAMSISNRLLIENKWRNSQQIGRMDPIIRIAGVMLGLTEAQMDQIFGIDPPAPLQS